MFRPVRAIEICRAVDSNLPVTDKGDGMSDSNAAADPTNRFRILGLSMVKNEQDVIEPFVRHNMRFLDALLIIDNKSKDRTREILELLCGEFPNLEIYDDPSFAFRQWDRITSLLHASQSNWPADFAVFLDADEFLLANDRAAFEATLDTIPRGGAGRMPWRTYVLTPGTAESPILDPPRSIEWRRVREDPPEYKCILRLDRELRPDLIVQFGAHGVVTPDGVSVPEIFLDLPLAHFPVRNAEQLIAKTVIGWLACLKLMHEGIPKTEMCWQWRESFEAIARGELPKGEDLALASYVYGMTKRIDTPASSIDWTRDVVRDPVAFDYRRAYSDGRFQNPIALIARAWRDQILASPS